MVDVIQRARPAAAPAQLESRRGDAALRQALVQRAAARAHQATWAPTLEGDDLACLLRVIEGELLPRLLGAYRPTDQAPLKASLLG